MKKKAIEVREEDIVQPNNIVVSEDSIDGPIVVEEDSVSQLATIQVGAWTNANDFVKYCTQAVRSGPEIRADNINSLRRAIAYFENLSKEIAEGAANDADHAELNMNQLEALDKAEEVIAAVREQLEVSASRVGMLKTASKAAAFVYVVDPFLFAIARLCINAKVSNGKNIEETFRKVAEKFQINERETFSLQQIMRDMGYPIAGSFVADEGSFDMIRQYFA